MNTKIKKWGNSLAIRIPPELAKDIGLSEETDVNIRVDKRHIIITPIVKITLEELLAQVIPIRCNRVIYIYRISQPWSKRCLL